MKNKSYAIILSLAILAGHSLSAFAGEQDLTARVSRAVLSKIMPQTEENYTVRLSLTWKKDITLGDMMWRNPRRPARKEQVIKSKHISTDCLGVLVDQGSRVLFPTVCLKQNGYELESVNLLFQNGHYISTISSEIVENADIAQIAVSAEVTAGLPYAVADRVPHAKSLQEFYGEEMTAHLREFFHDKNIFSCRVRRGALTSRPNLTLGEPLVYQGKVVALVKQTVDSYADGLSGISESAFAVIRY